MVRGCTVTDPSHLELAHVRPTGLHGRGRGMTERLRDVLHNPDAYRLVCRPHHVELGGPERWR